MHMKPNDSSSLFRYFEFSRGCWGSNTFPMVTLYKFVAQHNMHIIPPIKIVEGCEDPRCQGCWIIHLAASRSNKNIFNYSIYLQNHFNLKSNQLIHSLLLHVHILWVHHTWLDFFGQNPKGARKRYQKLCGTQLLLVH